MQRKRYTAKEKAELVNKYYAEESSQREFCVYSKMKLSHLYENP